MEDPNCNACVNVEKLQYTKWLDPEIHSRTSDSGREIPGTKQGDARILKSIQAPSCLFRKAKRTEENEGLNIGRHLRLLLCYLKTYKLKYTKLQFCLYGVRGSVVG
jgi:hypothetical protein